MNELREIRDKISEDIKDMTYEQLKKYLESKNTLHSKSAWSLKK